MSNKPSARRLTTLIVLFPLIALMVYGGSSYLFFFFTQQQETQKTLEEYENTLMALEKERLKEKVNALAQFINYYDNRSSEKIKEDVKNIVNVTVNVANNIYNRYRDTKSSDEIKAMIVAALDTIKFEGDIGYLFLLDLGGNTILHVDKKMQGTNILEIQDVRGKYIIKEFNKVLRRDGEGFVDYYWYIVSENRKSMYYKISYVKLLECYDWYVGAGEYLKYMSRFVKKDIINYIRSNARFHNGSFLLFDAEGKMLFNLDDNTTHALNKSEGFNSNANQLSFTRYIKEYDWYVVARRDLKDIKESIKTNQNRAETKRENDLKTNFYLLGFSWLVSLLLSLYLSRIITKQLRHYEEQINQSNEKLIFQSRQALIGELFSMIAHQWRQPVNKIASILAVLRMELEAHKTDSKTLDQKYEAIENNLEFMSETIDDFRTFYKPKSSSEQVNLKALIEQSLLFFESTVEKRNIRLKSTLESIEYELYQNEFVQVMLNLIKNAIDATGDAGQIDIALYRKNESVVITVENSVETIENIKLEKIFEPYYTTKKDSMGLGLYMVKIIIEKHLHGSVEVEKTAENAVRFVVVLP